MQPPQERFTKATAAITSINLDTNRYGGYNGMLGQFEILPMVQPGGHITIPAVGEQWMVEKIGGKWYLKAKTDWLDERTTAIPREEGMDIVGTMNGPTYITGSRVELPSSVWLSGVEIRVDGTTHKIQYKSGEDWIDMVGGGSEEPPTEPGPSSYAVPTRVSYIQTLGTRVIGLNQVLDGVRPGPCTLTEVTYEFGTADSSGSTVVELRKNGTLLAGSQLSVTAANQVTGSGTEAARTATGSWTFTKSDSLTVNTVSLGSGSGTRLTAHCYGTVITL